MSEGEPQDGHTHDAAALPSMLSPVRAGAHGYLALRDRRTRPRCPATSTAPPSAGCWPTPRCRCWCWTPVARRMPRPPTAPESRPEAAGASTPGSTPTGRWPKRWSTPGSRGWWPCATASTWSPPPPSSRTSTPRWLEGHEAGRGRHPGGARGLAEDPPALHRLDPRPLQDWVVPVALRLPPVALFRPPAKAEASRSLATPGARGGPRAGSTRRPRRRVLRRDKTLCLDRAFDDHQVVVLWALAGAGKTATAAEFTRWYLAHRRGRCGAVEQLRLHPSARLLTGRRYISPHHWAPTTSTGRRLSEPEQRDVALQLLGPGPAAVGVGQHRGRGRVSPRCRLGVDGRRAGRVAGVPGGLVRPPRTGCC